MINKANFPLVFFFLIAGACTIGIGIWSKALAQDNLKANKSLIADKEGETILLQIDENQYRELSRSFTREARRKAKPLAIPKASLELPLAKKLEPESLGIPEFTSDSKPDPDADIRAQYEFPDEWRALEESDTLLDSQEALNPEVRNVQPLSAAAPTTFTNYLGNYYTPMMHTYFPYRAIGKLYALNANNTIKSTCSASVISPNNVIVTAAHCVFNTITNTTEGVKWVFVPADRAGAAPYGTFLATAVRILTAWVNCNGSIPGCTPYDTALLKLGNNSAGRPVTYYAGSLARIWNYSYIQHFHAVGYPGNLPPNNATSPYTFICAAESYPVITDAVGMGCNMKHGASGGPWIISFKPYTGGAANYVGSVVSGMITSVATNNFGGIRFSSNNIVPLCNAIGC